MATENRKPVDISSDPDFRLDTELEADPMLRLSEGKASRLQIAFFGLAIIVIVCVVGWALVSQSQ